MVIAARFDPPLPLARLRARGQVTELRAQDLRLDRTEAAEVVGDVALVRLSDDHRSFLLRSSALDRMSGELCDAALHRSGSAALLDELERAGLFAVPLDERRQCYRYHRLFRDVLRRQTAAPHRSRRDAARGGCVVRRAR